MSEEFTVRDLYDVMADQISHGHGSYKVHLYFHHRHTSAPLRSVHGTLAGSALEPEGEWRLYLSTAPPEPESRLP